MAKNPARQKKANTSAPKIEGSGSVASGSSPSIPDLQGLLDRPVTVFMKGTQPLSGILESYDSFSNVVLGRIRNANGRAEAICYGGSIERIEESPDGAQT